MTSTITFTMKRNIFVLTTFISFTIILRIILPLISSLYVDQHASNPHVSPPQYTGFSSIHYSKHRLDRRNISTAIHENLYPSHSGTTTKRSDNLRLYKNTYGRLGNAMFQIAASFSIAKQNGRRLYLDGVADSILRNVFVSSKLNYTAGGAPLSTKEIFADEIHDDLRLPNEDIILCCYLESWRYFNRVHTQVREIFTFNRNILREAEAVLERDPRVAYVGIHVRRRGLPRNSIAPLTFLQNAMLRYRLLFPVRHFVVCSDDTAWCEEHLGNSSEVTVSSSDRPELDMAMLSLMNASIITYGTFGWWSAWLAGGEVIYWEHPTTPDFYPQHWMPMT